LYPSVECAGVRATSLSYASQRHELYAVLVECEELSLSGNRHENQDRVHVACSESAALIIVVDGMGGHAEGAQAAQVTVDTLRERFHELRHPVLDPQGFLTMTLALAHDRVVALGDSLALDHKPRATGAVCLVQESMAFFAHVGDSRIYQLRDQAIQARTRDHSHVELLLREGVIREHEMRTHPMRNFVECCLGGDDILPDMTVSGSFPVRPGDVLLACTDGFWSGLQDAEIAGVTASDRGELGQALLDLARKAVARNAPHSDNTSYAAVRWLAP
jgi:PPM family protein phosphatase